MKHLYRLGNLYSDCGPVGLEPGLGFWSGLEDLCVQDSKSLDQCLQAALSVLYPPFQSTSPTVLCQVLNVVENCYRGDGLRYLLHFLLPAKQLLHKLQQHACLQHCGLLFRHEGWPLCVHEKVVIQLCPLDQHLLCPGDFYLLISSASPPPGAHGSSCWSAVTSSPRLLLCSVPAGGHHVEQQEVSELALQSLFSMAWLDSVNRQREQRGASRLERCVLSANGDIFRVPWEDLVYPQFISHPQTAPKENKESSPMEKSGNLCGNSTRQDHGTFLPTATKHDQSPASSGAEDSEGEYVELTELPQFSPQKGSLTQSIRARTCTHTFPHTPHNNTHSAAMTHSSHTPNTHSCGELRSLRGLYSMLYEEKLNPISKGPVLLSPVSPNSPPSSPSFSTSQPENQASQEQTEGTDSTREQRQDEGKLLERKETKENGVLSVNKHLEETQCRRDEGLLPQEQTAKDGGETEEADESDETDDDKQEQFNEEEEDELKEDEAEEVEVEEEVQVIIAQPSQEKKEEEQVMTEDEGERESEETHIDKEASASENTCSYHETHTHYEDNSSESTKPSTHSEDSYSENIVKHSLCEISHTLDTHSEDSYFANNTKQINNEDYYYGKIVPLTDPKDLYSENTLTQSLDSYSENNTQQMRSEDFYCEKSKLPTHSEDLYSESTLPIQSEDPTKRTQSKDSYSENVIQHTCSEKLNTLCTHSGDSYSENNTLNTHYEDSYCDTLNPLTYCEESEGADTSSVSLPAMDSSQTEHVESDCGQKMCKEEVGEGTRAELQMEGLRDHTPPPLSKVSPRTLEPEHRGPLPQSATPAVPVQCPQPPQHSFYSVLLRSGALCLPGSRDRSGRAVLTVCTWSSVWSNPNCDRTVLIRLLLYYTSTLRKEVQSLGLTVLVDARRAAPVPALFSALRSLQEDSPGSIHSLLLLVNKDSSWDLEKPAAAQVEVLSSMKSVSKHVELQQLPVLFGGSFSFSQSIWIVFRSRVEQLTNQCGDIIDLLQKTISILENTPLPAAAEDAQLLLSRHKTVMCSVLEDSRLVQLQQEGGASLSWLRREESSLSTMEEHRVAVETVTSLYDQVDELLHRLVTLSNSKTQELTFILDFRILEQGFNEVRSWLEEVGEVRLKTLGELQDSLELLRKKQQDFKDFYTTAYDHCKRGEALLARLDRWGDVSSAELHSYEVKVHSFWAQLQDFSKRVKTTGQNLDRAVRLYSFLDQAYGWALEGLRHLAGISMEDCTLPDKCQAAIGCLEEYQLQHPPIPDAHFQEMKVEAGELRGERGLRQWSFAWSKCQETKKMFDRKMEAALRTRSSAHRQRSDSTHSMSSISSRKALSGLWGVRESSSFCPPKEDSSTSSPITSTGSQHTPLLRRLFRSISSDEFSSRGENCSPTSPSLPRLDSCSSSSSSTSFSRRQQLRKTQSYDCPSTPEASRYGPCARTLSEPVQRGNTGVFIRGLEVSSTEAADRTLCPRVAAHSRVGQGRSPRTPDTTRPTSSPETESRPRGSKLRHIVEEMVTTEREYVRSLHYIIHHYFPEMERADLPQDLRGKRSVVFGNLEKLLDFHNQFFLRELEACWRHPLRVPHCFIRHQEQFGLYALYSKNKPKSDALLANHGNAFFRRKQAELGDKMDLSSYLLKPVQRMSKYALLLTDLIKEVGVAQEAELAALQAATDMVKFQLRHGNDLLAMDAIQDCDVNLKEQGQLIRQDEFTVWTGRRKCQRHIFLFEELILFSKPKKMEGGLDVFIYKHSFKTADVGLTESPGDSGLRFEIWFRRRTSKNQTFILQAATSDIKHTWTSDIAQILWTQATRNKEMRLKEMVSMGVGNKPFLDIQPSDAAISDRAVHCIMKSRGARTRASIAVSVFDHSHPFKRGPMTSDPATSGPSSCSLLGPLNLHMFSEPHPPSPAAESSFITSCIEEDEQEHETSSQPSMSTYQFTEDAVCLLHPADSSFSQPQRALDHRLATSLAPPVPTAAASPPTSRNRCPRRPALPASPLLAPPPSSS
ncbi:uncharacterized protein plekhg4 isoform X2 [Echeneis naucrates]|uniref:uncharacterized protein plekhg4 isoform X2 n=1 Tax=Echeneis naucrates TaxID=173247 RepID=UPI00111334BA|nr:uncharacterized protein LOC115041600 isoform X2 [Echeneis naucrates]